MHRFLMLLAAAAVGLAACSSTSDTTTTDTSSPPTDELPHFTELNDHRYCEILVATRDRLTVTAYAYNTVGYDWGCPQEQWEALDADGIAEEWDAETVTLNGPRYVVMDEIKGHQPASGEFHDFGGIDMELRATIELRPRDAALGESPYTDIEIVRDTTYVYHQGQTVYELTSADGHTYVMQSYSQIIDPSLTINDLSNLSDHLQLPDGWTYQTRTLDQELTVSSNGLAYVINDDYLNSYQRIT